MLLVILSTLVTNVSFGIAYFYCYSGYLVSCFLYDFTVETSDAAFAPISFLFWAIAIFVAPLVLSVT